MADRVHPSFGDHDAASISPLSSSEHPLKPSPPSPEKPVPPPGTYVIQIPKDQVYRVPPPENARRLQNYARRSTRRSPCRLCLCSLLALVGTVAVLAGISAAVLFLVFRPESPRYSVEGLAIRGINASSPAPEISPAIDVTIRAENPNGKLGVYYGRESSVKIYYADIELCDGVTPAFYHPTNNVTVFTTVLTGPGIELTASMKKALRDGEKKGNVPLRLRMNIPVRMKVGSVKTWTLAVKLRCDITVDKLTANSKIVKKDCDRSWRLWW